jgi:hypothetical protein
LLHGINVFLSSSNRSEHCGLLPRAGPQRAGSDFADHIVFALKNASLVNHRKCGVRTRHIVGVDCFSSSQSGLFDVYRMNIEPLGPAQTVLPMAISPAKRWYHLQSFDQEPA